jgi:hypothetical protein
VFYNDTELIEQTRALCADDLRSAKLSEQLLAIELGGHRKGWSQPEGDPHLFQLDMHPDTGDTDWTMCDGYNGMLRATVERLEGDTGRALQLIARHAENVTRLLRTGVPPEGWAERVPAELLDGLQRMRERSYPLLTEAGLAGEDLVGAEKDGYDFVGYGIRAEVWAAYTSPGKADEAKRYAYAGRLHEYPQRQEFRYIWFITRTGDTWIVERRRSHLPVIVRLHPREETPHHLMGGNIFNALGRLVNAVVTEDVPVWNRAMPKPPVADQPNPLIRLT